MIGKIRKFLVRLFFVSGHLVKSRAIFSNTCSTLLRRNPLRRLQKINFMESEGSEKVFLELETRAAPLVALESGIYILLAILVLLGNLLVLGTVYKSPLLRQNTSAWLITSLAVSDVTMALLCAPPTLAALVSGRWVSGFAVCQAQGYLVMWLACVSVETMALTAVDRYVRVLHPIKHRTLFSPKRVKRYIVAVWIFAGTAPAPYVAAGKVYVFHPGKMFCVHDHLLSAASYVIYAHVTVALVVLTCCYIQVWRGFRANAIRLKDVRSLPERGARITRQDVAMTRTLFVTVLGFLFCWTPILVMDLIAMARGMWSFKRWSFVMYCDLGLLSSCLNPIIYGAMNKMFRSEYKNLFAKTTSNAGSNGTVESGPSQ